MNEMNPDGSRTEGLFTKGPLILVTFGMCSEWETGRDIGRG